jgi:hypothetical protein
VAGLLESGSDLEGYFIVVDEGTLGNGCCRRRNPFVAEPLPPLKPIPIKDRLSVLYIEKGGSDVLNGTFVVVNRTGMRTHIPVGGAACLMLEPGAPVFHAAVALAARVGTLMVCAGETGVRLYSAAQLGGARSSTDCCIRQRNTTHLCRL